MMKAAALRTVLFLITFMLFAAPAIAAGNISTTGKYAWSETSDWVNFGPSDGGVTVYPDHLEGYAWAENVGWIKLGSYSGGGAHTYSNTSDTDWGVNRSGADLSGYAWSETAGWINFNPSGGGVTADPVSGEFDGYAWGENMGWIHFRNSSPAYGVVYIKTDQTITFGPLSDRVYGESFTASATGGGSGSPVTFSIASGPATATGTNGSMITVTGTGSVTVRASQAGDSYYNAAPDVDQTFSAGKSDTATSITSQSNTATTTAQSFTVNYSVNATAPGSGTPGGSVTVSDGVDGCAGTVAAGSCSLTLTTTGARTLTATYAGDLNFNSSVSSAVSHDVCATAATTVTNTSDSGPGSLRQAIVDTCPGGTIDFDPGVDTITLTSDELLIDKDMTINGPGEEALTVKRSTESATPEFRIFNIAPGQNVTISGLTITGGSAPGPDSFGGGIYNSGDLNLKNSTVISNVAENEGGGIYSEGGLVVEDSIVANNTAYEYGGGISSYSAGASEIKGSVISGNIVAFGFGGGIAVYDGDTTITDSAVSDNWIVLGLVFGGSGGGVYAEYGTLTISGSTISGNEAALAGAIAADTADLTIGSSTIFGNKAGLVGAVFAVGGPFSMESSTVSDNEAGSYGGLLLVGGFVTINGSTIAGNLDKHLLLDGTYNGGVLIESDDANITNTIISSAGGTDCEVYDLSSAPASLTTNVNNFVKDASCSPLLSGDPMLDPLGLQDNGGPTETIALLSGSPAIDAGSGCPATDQRGIVRPQGSHCDIGAYEFVPSTSIIVGSSFNPSTYGGSVTFTATITDSEAASEPTGTVTFKDGGTDITGCAGIAVSSGIAACTLSTLTGGDHAVTAEYTSDSSFSGSTSEPVTQTVNGANQTVTVTASAPPFATFNASFNVSATASSGLDVAISASGACTGSGAGAASITMTGATSTCTVHYNQAGDANYNAAPEVTESTSIQFVVTPIAGTGGKIEPAAPQLVNHDGTAAFTVTPDAGYYIASVSGCGGQLIGNTYLTGQIVSSCDVTAAFTACSYSVAPLSAVFGPSGGNGSVDITAHTDCPWTALSSDPWITITAGDSGGGNGTVEYTVSENPGLDPRAGSITVEDQVVDITQSALTPPNILINSPAINFGQEDIGGYAGSMLTLTNTGDEDLVVNSLGLYGSTAGMFTVDKGTCPSLTPTLATNESCSIEVVFQPKSMGTKTAALTIGSNDPDESQMEVPLEGTGVMCPITFSDVPPGAFGRDYILTIACNGITTGCGSDNFCPEEVVSRAQMAVFVLKALGEQPSDSCTGLFNDVDETTGGSPVFCRYIEKFSALGITAGCGNGNYCPDDPVSRMQTAVFITRALGETMAATCDGTFNDVNVNTGGNSAFCRYIEKFATLGITAGCDNDNYCPSSPGTRAQMAILLTKGFLQ
jgi:predicted outer membrane repeat protein